MPDPNFKPPKSIQCPCDGINQVRPDVTEVGLANIRCDKCRALLVLPTPDWKEVAAEVICLMNDREARCRYCNQPGKEHGMRIGGGRDRAYAKVECPKPYIPIAAGAQWDGHEHLVLKDA